MARKKRTDTEPVEAVEPKPAAEIVTKTDRYYLGFAAPATKDGSVPKWYTLLKTKRDKIKNA